LTHKEVMHLDRLYFGSFVQMDGAAGLAVYAVTFLAAACVLYFCVERPFLKLRDRILICSNARADGPLRPADLALDRGE
jgi:peptidoglycan/LPS O-acetylase OafA/YrhL